MAKEDLQGQAYCVKCKKMIDVKDGVLKMSKNGRRMLSGKCPNCNTSVNKFLPNEKK